MRNFWAPILRCGVGVGKGQGSSGSVPSSLLLTSLELPTHEDPSSRWAQWALARRRMAPLDSNRLEPCQRAPLTARVGSSTQHFHSLVSIFLCTNHDPFSPSNALGSIRVARNCIAGCPWHSGCTVSAPFGGRAFGWRRHFLAAPPAASLRRRRSRSSSDRLLPISLGDQWQHDLGKRRTDSVSDICGSLSPQPSAAQAQGLPWQAQGPWIEQDLSCGEAPVAHLEGRPGGDRVRQLPGPAGQGFEGLPEARYAACREREHEAALDQARRGGACGASRRVSLLFPNPHFQKLNDDSNSHSRR